MDDMVVYMKEKSILYEIKSLEKLIARTFMLASKLDIKETKKFPTPSQIQIIQYIVTSKKTVYQSELEDVLNLRRATVSGILKFLTALHLEKAKSPIFLTPYGIVICLRLELKKLF